MSKRQKRIKRTTEKDRLRNIRRAQLARHCKLQRARGLYWTGSSWEPRHGI